ncbi:hypothetical protein CBL_20541 [Carabus blaptoides fortunei]
MESDLWTIIESGEDEPDQDATASAKRAYLSRQEKAHAKIALAICDEQQMHIRSLTSPKNVWEDLQRLYAPKDSKFRTVPLRRKLYSLKMADCESIENYLGEINITVADLSSIVDTIEDGDLAMTTLCVLSDDWDTVVSALCNFPEGDFKSATIKRRLVAEDARHRENTDSKSKSAMFLKGTKTSPKPNNQKSGKTVEMTTNNKRPKQTKKKTAQKGKLICFIWGEKGHIARYSPENKNAKKKNNDKKNARWQNYSDKGKGTVKVKIKNNPAILHEFEAKNTLLVPEIDHEILSVKQLTENDKKVVFHKEGCFIYDKDDQLLIKAEQKGRLYTINTEPGVINSSMLNSLKHKDTKMETLELWHRRMMHANRTTEKRCYKTETAASTSTRNDTSFFETKESRVSEIKRHKSTEVDEHSSYYQTYQILGIGIVRNIERIAIY